MLSPATPSTPATPGSHCPFWCCRKLTMQYYDGLFQPHISGQAGPRTDCTGRPDCQVYSMQDRNPSPCPRSTEHVLIIGSFQTLQFANLSPHPTSAGQHVALFHESCCSFQKKLFKPHSFPNYRFDHPCELPFLTREKVIVIML